MPHTYTLPNGLKVIIDVNPSAPVVSTQIGVRVGSAFETDDETGLSHLLEHMVFKGTTDFAAGQIARDVEAFGGELNAYTSLDQTVYYINLPARHYHEALHIISQMIFEATMDPVELEREKEVVLEEIRRGKDSPSREATETLFNLAFRTHPYGRPVIGTMESVKGFPRDKVFEYYKRWYTPSNMVLVVSGDVNLPDVEKIILERFGHRPDKPVSVPTLPQEPYPTGPRVKRVTKDVEGNYLYLSYPIPELRHEDGVTLDVLSHILGEGESSRLEQRIKEQKRLVNSIHSYAYSPRWPGLFIIQANLPHGDSLPALEATFHEVETLKRQFVSKEELDRAVLNIKSSVYYEKETCEGQARKWISYETTIGDYAFEEEYFRRLDLVTPQTIREAARRYLNPRAISAVLLQSDKHKKPFVLPKSVDKMRENKGPVLYDEAHDVKAYRFPNGLRLLLRENKKVPLISVYLASMGGLRYETASQNGISQLMTSCLTKETKNRNAQKIAEINDSIAGHVSAFSGNNSWGLSSSFLSEKAPIALDLFVDTLLNPLFSAEEVAKEKHLHLEAIRNQSDSVAHIAYRQFSTMLFGKHPYAMPALGSKETLAKINPAALHKFYNSLINPAEMVLSVSGSFDREAILDFFGETLGTLPKKKETRLKLNPPRPHVRPAEKTLYKKRLQAHLVLGFLGPTLSSKDRYTVEVLNNVLAGQGGRLFLRLRDVESLAYTVTSNVMFGIETGMFSVYIGTDGPKADAAIKGILRELNLIREETLTDHELNRAKEYIIGNHEIDLQRNSSVASQLAFSELYGPGFSEYRDYSSYIEKVTAQEVRKAARKYLNLDGYVLSVVRPK